MKHNIFECCRLIDLDILMKSVHSQIETFFIKFSSIILVVIDSIDYNTRENLRKNKWSYPKITGNIIANKL
jgi:hypothetical protein